MQTSWLTYAKCLQAIAQSGLTYCKDVFDIERYEQIRTIAAEITAAHTDKTVEEIEKIFSAETGYATPKAGARAAVIRYVDAQPELLLVQELAENSAWTLPGGFVDVGDTPSSAAERETFEETGYRVKAHKVIAVASRDAFPDAPPSWPDLWQTVMQCELVGGEPKMSVETGESRFFALDALPENISSRRSNKQIIEWIKAHVADEGRSADFN